MLGINFTDQAGSSTRANLPAIPMLRIRQAQLDAFQAEHDRPLVQWIVQQLRREQEAALAGIADDDLAMGVKAAIGRARRHGFATSMQLFRYVDACYRYGAEFDRAPAVVARLTDGSRGAEARLDAALIAAAESLR